MALAVTPLAQSDPESGYITAAAVWNAEDPHADLSELLVVHEGLGLGELTKIAGSEANEVRCALDLSSSPRGRRQLLAELAAIPGLSNVVGVEAPLAIFATQWHESPLPVADEPLRVIVFENAEACSVLVAHTGLRRILSIGVVETGDDIMSLILKAVRAGSDNDTEPTIEPNTSWDAVLEQVETVYTVGLSEDFANRFDELFGRRVTVGRPAHAVLYGLTRIEALASWSASWPTTRLHLGDGWTRQPGPLRAAIEEHLTRLRPASGLRFSDDTGADVPVKAGSVLSSGCMIPERLGTQPRLRLIDDGRLLMLGPPGTRPLAIELGWPIAGSQVSPSISIRSASTVGVELSAPWRAAASEVREPPSSLFPLVPEDVGKIDP